MDDEQHIISPLTWTEAQLMQEMRARKKSSTKAKERICTFPNCGAILSERNPTDKCLRHPNLEIRASLAKEPANETIASTMKRAAEFAKKHGHCPSATGSVVGGKPRRPK